MAAADELIGFVRESLERGVPRARVEEVLVEAGWSRDQLRAALDAFAEIDFPVPVPRPRPYLSAREAFTYLLLFSMLYVSAYNLGVLLFDYINRAFPDPARPVNELYASPIVRWALAALIVSFPVFAYLHSTVKRAVRADPAKRRSHVRRWLTYATVFIASCAIIGDVIALVYNALGGELTIRFMLKVLTIGLIAGTALLHYLADLRLEDTKAVPDEPRWNRVLSAATIGVVAIAALAGLPVAGSPSAERARRLDGRRVDELRGIVNATNVYFGRHQRLPASLGELSAEGGLDVLRRAADAGPFEYRVSGDRRYELCAVFEEESRSASDSDRFWAHGAGRQCFQLEAKAP